MEFNQIRYFLAVADCLNFTQAADRCSVSQPALSKAIRKLEDNLGGELFMRSTNEVELTEFGRLMKIHFERIEETRRIARTAAKVALGADGKRLEIGVMCTINAHRFIHFIEGFRTNNPQVEFTLHDVTGPEIHDRLLMGDLDCVFCARSQTLDQRFQGVRLFDEDMVVAFHKSHRFSEFETVSVLDLATEPYLDRLHCEFREQFLELTRSSGVSLNVILNSEREDWIFEFLRNGSGVSVVPVSSINDEDITFRRIAELKNRRVVELVMTEQAATSIPSLTMFQQAAVEYYWN